MTAHKPLSKFQAKQITLAHGGGGKAMADLIEDVFFHGFNPPIQKIKPAFSMRRFARNGARLYFTTDSFVIHPLEFPGGDIGRLAVCGTVNDLAVGGNNLYGFRRPLLSKRG